MARLCLVCLMPAVAGSEKAVELLTWLIDAQDEEGIVRADDITEKAWDMQKPGM